MFRELFDWAFSKWSPNRKLQKLTKISKTFKVKWKPLQSFPFLLHSSKNSKISKISGGLILDNLIFIYLWISKTLLKRLKISKLRRNAEKAHVPIQIVHPFVCLAWYMMLHILNMVSSARLMTMVLKNEIVKN